MALAPGVYGLVWYERYGTDLKRMLLNRLVSSICWTGFLYYSIPFSLDLVRYTFGPLPKSVCLGQLVFKNALHLQNVIFCNAIAMVRYLLFFWLKNTSEYQDEFWSLFINIWAVSFSFLNQFVYVLMPGSLSLNFFFCAGRNPVNYDPVKINYVYVIVLIISIFFQILVALRIIAHKVSIANVIF